MTKTQRVVVIEGFTDRAFVKGLLIRLGCTSRGASGKPAPLDPWDAEVKGGQYAFVTSSNAFVRVVHSNDDKLEKRARHFIKGAATHPVEHLLLVPDSDETPGSDPIAALAGRVNLFKSLFTSVGSLGPLSFSSIEIPRVEYGVWAETQAHPGLPPTQTLERLVSAAFLGAYRARFAEVTAFLATRTAPPAVSGKETAMALMAGWYADRYSENFFEAIWADAAVAAELEVRLRATGTYQAFERIAA